MIRLLLISALLLSWHTAYCQDATIIWPIPAPAKPACTGQFCTAKGIAEQERLLQLAANECLKCKCGKKVFVNWPTYCEMYTNYDQNNYLLQNCIATRFTNPCYPLYHQMQDILNKYCGDICQIGRDQFNFYTLTSDYCYGCNGCPQGCAIQAQNIVYYQPAIPVDTVVKGGAAAPDATTPAAAPAAKPAATPGDAAKPAATPTGAAKGAPAPAPGGSPDNAPGSCGCGPTKKKRHGSNSSSSSSSKSSKSSRSKKSGSGTHQHKKGKH